MARLNIKTAVHHGYTHEGARAAAMTPEQALRRSVMSCLLFEKEFYEDGEKIADRIVKLAEKVPPNRLAWIAVEAREKANLRHVPLLLLSVLSRTGKGEKGVADTISRVIQRADELGELLAIHAKLNGVKSNDVKKTISAQMKKGIARAFTKFDEYSLQKYNRDSEIKLRDALFLSHAKPLNKEQGKLWARLVKDELETPATWEVMSSSAKSRGLLEKQKWEEIIDQWIE